MPPDASEPSGSRDPLRREAHQLHGLFFSGALDDEVAERYAQAHARCIHDGPEALRALEPVFRLGLDAEAIEYVQRLHGRGSLLTRKIQILFYLLEVRSRYYEDFVARPASRLATWLGVAGSLLRSVGKYLKGHYLIWRHGLA